MTFKTVAAFKTEKSWGHMQYVNPSYDIGKTPEKVLGRKLDLGKFLVPRILICLI